MINNTLTSDETNDNVKHIEEADSDTIGEQAPEQPFKVNVLSSKSDEFFKKSVKQQVEELATEQGVKVSSSFLNPPGYEFRIGYNLHA